MGAFCFVAERVTGTASFSLVATSVSWHAVFVDGCLAMVVALKRHLSRLSLPS